MSIAAKALVIVGAGGGGLGVPERIKLAKIITQITGIQRSLLTMCFTGWAPAFVVSGNQGIHCIPLLQQPQLMPSKRKRSSRENILAATLELMDSGDGADAVTMRRVAASASITPMAIYKHFQSRDALLVAAASAEYRRIAGYFERANARTDVKGMRGMLGYLDYALDHPQLFRFMFSGNRPEAFSFPGDLEAGASPTFGVLLSVVKQRMDQGILERDDAAETALSIWAHAHGLIALFLSGRIKLPRIAFRKLYMRSLDRLLNGLATRC